MDLSVPPPAFGCACSGAQHVRSRRGQFKPGTSLVLSRDPQTSGDLDSLPPSLALRVGTGWCGWSSSSRFWREVVPHGLPIQEAPVSVDDLAQWPNFAGIGNLDLVVGKVQLVEANVGAREVVPERQDDGRRKIADFTRVEGTVPRLVSPRDQDKPVVDELQDCRLQ